MNKKNRTQKQIDEDNNNLMKEIVALNEDMHDNCQNNTCTLCKC